MDAKLTILFQQEEYFGKGKFDDPENVVSVILRKWEATGELPEYTLELAVWANDDRVRLEKGLIDWADIRGDYPDAAAIRIAILKFDIAVKTHLINQADALIEEIEAGQP